MNQTGFFNDDQWIAGVAWEKKIDLSKLFESPIEYIRTFGELAFLKRASEIRNEANESKFNLKSKFQIILLPRIVLPPNQLSVCEFSQTISRPLGTICYERRLPQIGTVKFIPSHSGSVTKCKNKDALYIDSTESIIRTPIAVDPKSIKGRNVFVARVPDNFDLSFLKDASSIFTAGISSWKKLLKQGLSVNGCVESLGEDELHSTIISDLFPGDWVKLTHSNSLALQNLENESHLFFSNVIPFYQIEKLDPKNNFTSKTHFYWKSVDQFLRAYEQDPSITEKFHGSGIGITAKFLQKKFPNIKLLPCLNEEQFINEVL